MQAGKRAGGPGALFAGIAILLVAASGCCAAKGKGMEEMWSRAGTPTLKQKIEEQKNVEALTHFSVAQQKALDGDIDQAISELRAALRADPDSAYLRRILAYMLLQKGKSDEAMKEIDLSIKSAPEDPGGYHIKGLILLEGDMPAEAEAEFRKALDIEPGQSEFAINLADSLVRQKKIAEALKVLDDFSAESPADLDVRYYMALLYRETGKIDRAIEICREIVAEEPGYYPAIRDLFQMEAARGNFKEAAKRGGMLLNNFPEDYETRLLLTDVFLRLDRPDQALSVMDGGKRSGPHIPDWWWRSGLILLDLKKPDQAREEFEAALSLDPASAEAVFGLGLVELEEGHKVEAMSYFESVPADSPLYVEAQRRLALIATGERQFSRALSIMEKLYEKSPDNLGIIVTYSAVCRQAEELSRAETILKKALQKDPANEKLNYELGMVYYLQGRADESVAAMEKILETNPDSARALNFIGYSWAERGIRLDDAEANIRRALELSPGAGYIMDSLGWVYYQRGEYDQAMEWLLKALDNEGEDAEILEHVGDCHLAMGNKSKAAEIYERALEEAVMTRVKTRIEKKLEELR